MINLVSNGAFIEIEILCFYLISTKLSWCKTSYEILLLLFITQTLRLYPKNTFLWSKTPQNTVLGFKGLRLNTTWVLFFLTLVNISISQQPPR